MINLLTQILIKKFNVNTLLCEIRSIPKKKSPNQTKRASEEKIPPHLTHKKQFGMWGQTLHDNNLSPLQAPSKFITYTKNSNDTKNSKIINFRYRTPLSTHPTHLKCKNQKTTSRSQNLRYWLEHYKFFFHISYTCLLLVCILCILDLRYKKTYKREPFFFVSGIYRHSST